MEDLEKKKRVNIKFIKRREIKTIYIKKKKLN